MREDDVNNSSSGKKRPRSGVPISPKAREEQIIAKAMDLAERKIEDGTASSQLICHFLKMNDPDDQIRHEILEKKRDLLVAQTENIKASQRSEEALNRVVMAMKRYSGLATTYEDDEDYSEF